MLILQSVLISPIVAQPASINVDPSNLVVQVCQNFTVNINITNVSNLYSYEFKLYYNTTFIDGLSVELPPGHFLEPFDPTKLYTWHKEINDNYNATHGRVWVSLELLPPEPPKAGSGILTKVKFHCTDEGQTKLDLDGTVLRDPFGGQIPHTSNDGNVAATAPASLGILPIETTVPILETFTVNVSIYNVRDLYKWKFDMSFNSASIECLNVEEGPFLRQGGTTQFTSPVINNTAGTIVGANCSLVGAGSGVTGSGTLAMIRLRCKSVGKSILDLNNTRLYNSTSVEIFHTVNDGSVNQVPTVTYRLLAVEKFYSNDTGYQFAMKSAQCLIQNLTRFRNWQNGTWGDYNYRAYIHLLSNATVAPSLMQFYRGPPTRESILNEITTFLNDTGPGESNNLTIRIFYYCGHTEQVGWAGIDRALDLRKGTGYDPTQVIYEGELNQTFTTGDLKNSNCTLVVLDTCYSGGYLDNMTRAGRVILTSTLKTKSMGWITNTPSPGFWSWFTGHQNATCWNGTLFGPVGIIGGLFNAKDKNGDGWRSAGEVFDFAQNTTRVYAKAHSHTMIPLSSYGVAGGGIPLVMYNEYIKYHDPFTGKVVEVPMWFPNNAAPRTPPTATSPVGRWSMFGNNANRTRFSSANGTLIASSVWTTSIGIPFASSAAIVEGMVFVGVLGGTELPCGVLALDAVTGEVIWSFLVNGLIYSSPAVIDGLVFIGTLGGGKTVAGTLYALDQYTGFVRWKFETPNGTGVFSSPAVADGRVFFGLVREQGIPTCGTYALNETTGEPLWFFETITSIKSSPAVANNMVFVGTLSNEASSCTVYALNASSGQMIWNYVISQSQIISTPSADDDTVYIATMWKQSPGGTVYAFNQFVGGSPKWQFPITSPFSSSPAIDANKNLLIIGSESGQVYALNRTNGNLKWSQVVGSINMSSPSISKDGLVYIGSIEGNLYCLNETTGAIVWNYPIPESIIASPALTDEHVIISTIGAESVYCIGPPFPIHDVAVFNANVSPNTVTRGDPVNVTYAVVNNGNVQETFEVTCSTNNTEIWSPPLYNEPVSLRVENITLSAGANATRTYTWNTTDFTGGTYTVMVQAALPIEVHETLLANNIYVGGNVAITEVGVHDVAITDVKPGKTVVGQSYSMSIQVNHTNQGYFMEIFNAAVYANETMISQTEITLTSGNSTVVTFVWNTTGWAKGNYTIDAYAWPVPGETDMTDNSLTDGWVFVAIVGDVDANGKVDMIDLWEEARHFGIDYPDIRFKPNFDIDDNGKIDMIDLWITAREFGKIDP